MSSLPVYKFLCDIQNQQERNQFYFDWGKMGNDFKFLPRVCYKNVIFTKTTWNMDSEELTSFLQIENDQKLLSIVNKWRLLHQIPEESLFSFDSLCILKTLKVLRNIEEDYRWMVALKLIDSLLFGFDFDDILNNLTKNIERINFLLKKPLTFRFKIGL